MPSSPSLPLWLITPVHYALVVLYIATPLLVLARAIRLARPPAEKPGALIAFFAVFLLGAALGVGLNFAYALLGDARVLPVQAALAAYFATALILILRCVNVLAHKATARFGHAGTFLRAVLVTSIALPWVMSAAMVYRPKVRPVLTPMALARWPYEAVAFPATDGSRVSAYFIPALLPPGGGLVPEDWGTRTVLLVHGLGSNKGNALIMARNLVPAGFNVLSLDLRAHGESAGQFTGIGSTEDQDILGALAWLKATKPHEAAQVFGLGASQGAAALLQAAADPRGTDIEAIAVLGTFADLSSLMSSITNDRFPGPLGFLLRNLAFPLAELHSGAPLRAFAPAVAARDLWPRPLLVIHGLKDEIIPVNQGRQLFNAAALPKDILLLEGTHNSILVSEEAATAVLQFFRAAAPLPLT